MLNRNQNAAARQLLLTFHLLSSGRPKDEINLRESLPPYGRLYESLLRKEGDREKARDALRHRLAQDVEALARAGIQIEVEGEAEGRRYRLPSNGFSPSEIELSEEERSVLANALRAMSRKFPYSEPLHLALANLVGATSSVPGTADDQAALETALALGRDAAVSRRLGVIESAILRHKRVRFAYRPVSGDEPSAREIEPYLLSALGETWYVTGRDTAEGIIRQFNVSRMRGRVVFATRRDGGDFELPEAFERLFAGPQAPWQLGEPVGKAQVRISSREAMRRLLRSFRWAGTFGFDGSYRTFITTYADDRPLAGWILSLGMGAEAIAPESLVDRVVDGLEKLIAAHGEGR